MRSHRLARSRFIRDICLISMLVALCPITSQADDLQGEILVPRVVIYPGDLLSASKLEKKVILSADAVGLLSSSADVTALVARRTLVPGQPIPKDAIRGQYVIKQGQPVAVRFVAGSISIDMNATAVQSGAVGETILVRNADSGRTLRVTINQDGTLWAQLP